MEKVSYLTYLFTDKSKFVSLTINKQEQASARIVGISSGLGEGKKEEDKEKKHVAWKAE